jgi:hypothetical protein
MKIADISAAALECVVSAGQTETPINTGETHSCFAAEAISRLLIDAAHRLASAKPGL